MKTRYTITVTEQDCAEGVRGNSHWCAVQTAIARLIPGSRRIEADTQSVRFSLIEDGKRYRLVYLSPPAVRRYIIDFDAGRPTKPMEFVLENPQVAEIKPTPPGTARTGTFHAAARGTGVRRSKRVFGERSYEVNKRDGQVAS